MSNIFEQAIKQKLRFQSERGDLTVEQLYDLPLTSRNGFDLDTVAKTVNQALKSVTEDSFVSVSTNPSKAPLELKLEIVKHIIAEKIQLQEEAKNRAAKSAERERLLSILAVKQDEALKSLSADEIKKRLEELGA